MKPNQTQIIIISAEASMWYNTMIGEKLIVKKQQNTSLPYYEYEGQKIVFKTDCKEL
jgi:hypothetical protein